MGAPNIVAITPVDAKHKSSRRGSSHRVKVEWQIVHRPTVDIQWTDRSSSSSINSKSNSNSNSNRRKWRQTTVTNDAVSTALVDVGRRDGVFDFRLAFAGTDVMSDVASVEVKKALPFKAEFLGQLWDRDYCGNGIQIIDDDANNTNASAVIIRKTTGGIWDSILVRNAISVDSCNPQTKQFEWEIKARKGGGTGNTRFAFMLGLVSDEIPADILKEKMNGGCPSKKNWNVSETKLLPCAVYMDSTYQDFRLYGRDGNKIRVSEYAPGSRFSADSAFKFEFGVGDRYGLRFDFATHECHLVYNGELVATVYRNVPRKVRLMLTVGWKGQEFCCTKCNAI
jgi:hypothetical protein